MNLASIELFSPAMLSRALVIILLASLPARLPAQCIDEDSIKLVVDMSSKVETDAKILPTLLLYANRINLCLYKHDSTHCLLLKTIGDLYNARGDHLKAIQYYEQAIGLVKAGTNKGSTQTKVLVDYYYSLSEAFSALNNNSQRMACLDSAVATGIKLGYIDRLCLWALYCKILHFFDIGDYSRCMESAELCERLGKEYAAGPMERILPGGLIYASSSLHMNIMSLLRLRRYQDAEKLLLEHLEEYVKRHDVNLGTLYEQLGEATAYTGNSNKSLFYFKKAFELERAKGDLIHCMAIQNNIGYFVYYINNRNLDSALYYYRKALSLKNDNTSLEKEYALESLNILASVANVFARKGFFESAFDYFKLAFDQIRPGITDEQIVRGSPEELRVEKMRYLTDLFIDKASAFHQSYIATGNANSLREAIRVYRLADQLLDRVRAGQFDEESKLFWRGDSRRLYEGAIDASFSAKDAEGAFYFFEKSRAVILNDQLREQSWMSQESIARQTQLKTKINFMERQMKDKNADSTKIKSLEDELFFSRQELDKLNESIKIQNPLYYRNFIDSANISLEELGRQILVNHQAFVEIYAGDSAVYELVLTKERSYFKRIQKPEFDELSKQYVKYISDPVSTNIHFDDLISISEKLYHLCFDDIKVEKGRIIISPDGDYFPFEPMVISSKNGDVKYFLEDYSVTYTYSARYLLKDYTKANGRSVNFVGFAPVNFQRYGFPDLAGSDACLMRLQRYFPEFKALSKDQASRNNFLKNYYSYGIIQLFSHGSDTGYNGEPVLWFADSALLLSDLNYEHKPNTRLIVLSACETGSGKLYKGEGIFSFSRGFASLGIPSSISNLWTVDNKSSYQITEQLYKYLSQGLSIDEALQKAKLDFILTGDREKRLPYYWASSVFVGVDDSFQLPARREWKWAPLVVAVLSVLVFLAIRVYQNINGRNKLHNS